MRNVNIRRMLYIAVFSAILAVSAWISVPSAVPFTLQTFALFFSFMTLGGASGTVSALIYISLGIVGLPVFSGFGAGLGTILGAGGGFIISFPISGIVYAALEGLFGIGRKRKIVYTAISLSIIYILGAAWFSFVYADGTGFIEALTVTVLPFIIPDILKILLAFYASEREGALINLNRGKANGKSKDRQN
jgi:biotin transport system substrate-specific component